MTATLTPDQEIVYTSFPIEKMERKRGETRSMCTGKRRHRT